MARLRVQDHPELAGSYARKQFISIDYSCFADLIDRLDKLGANLEKVIGDTMEQVAEEVQAETVEALDDANLPAEGIYSTGETKRAVLQDVKTIWQGSQGSINLGFDKTKHSAGGYLITGTPKMRPDYALEKIYSSKKYEANLKKEIENSLQSEIDSIMGG